MTPPAKSLLPVMVKRIRRKGQLNRKNSISADFKPGQAADPTVLQLQRPAANFLRTAMKRENRDVTFLFYLRFCRR
jgi:hypothetical protein